MADLNDFISDMARMRQAISEALPDIATKVALAGKALAERNIRNEGFGQLYKSQAYIKKRTKRGLPTAFVNLSFENRMWSNIQVIKVERNGDTVNAFLGATNVEDQDKMNWNYENYGSFIENNLRQAGQDLLQEVAAQEFNDIQEQFKPQS